MMSCKIKFSKQDLVQILSTKFNLNLLNSLSKKYVD
jgi:hypothetical protein